MLHLVCEFSGIDYEVYWYPLDKDGNVTPILTDPNKPQQKYVAPVFLGQSPSNLHQPPFDNPNGFLVKVRIPPQPTRNNASLGTHLDIYTTNDSELIK